MRCPFCDHMDTRVLDSRPVNDVRSIRRRRECASCLRRFTTFETVEEIPLIVVKKDGTREQFSRDKVLRGLIRACEKRPVSLETLEHIAEEIERDLRNMGLTEVGSDLVGEAVMKRLIDVDEVAYVRFASVYRQFKDITVFLQELNELLGKSLGGHQGG